MLGCSESGELSLLRAVTSADDGKYPPGLYNFWVYHKYPQGDGDVSPLLFINRGATVLRVDPRGSVFLSDSITREPCQLLDDGSASVRYGNPPICHEAGGNGILYAVRLLSLPPFPLNEILIMRRHTLLLTKGSGSSLSVVAATGTSSFGTRIPLRKGRRRERLIPVGSVDRDEADLLHSQLSTRLQGAFYATVLIALLLLGLRLFGDYGTGLNEVKSPLSPSAH